jgi:hypothetical protein
MINLSTIVNDEQLLEFALSHVCEKDSDDVHPVADQIIVTYIINQFEREGKESFDINDIVTKQQELMADYILTKLSNDGLVDINIDEDGQITYQLSKTGKDKVKNEC